MKRLLTAAAAATLLMLSAPLAANAADYNPPSTSGSSTPTSSSSAAGAAGAVTNPAAAGSGFTAGQTVPGAPTQTLSADGSATIDQGTASNFLTPPVFDPGESVSMTITKDSDAQGLRADRAAFVEAPPTATSVKASASGSVAFSLRPSEPGTYTLTLTGESSGSVFTSTIVVKAVANSASAVATTNAGAAAGAAGGNGSNLSYTGVNSTMITFGALGGGLALVIGAGLVWLGATKRRGTQHA